MRWSAGRLAVFDLPTDMGTRLQQLRLGGFDCVALDLPVAMESGTSPVMSATPEAVIVGPDLLDNPEIVNETPPSQMEATIIDEEFDPLDPLVLAADTAVPEIAIAALETSATFTAMIRAVGWKKLEAAIKYLAVSRPVVMVREGLGVMTLVPIQRTAVNLYRMTPALRMSYWKELVSQVDRRPRDLELLGIFPNVPTRGVDKASIDSGRGVIRLWLGLEAKGSRAGTLLVARDRENGAIYRVFDRRSVPGGLS